MTRFRTAAFVAGSMLTLSCAGVAAARADAPASAPSATPAPQARTLRRNPDRGVEAMIKHLHGELRITPAQEPQWQKLAAVMRANTASMSGLVRTRHEHVSTQSAKDDLESYAVIAQAHADAIKKLIPPFEALYDSMSAEQKQAADEEFRDHYRGHHRSGK